MTLSSPRTASLTAVVFTVCTASAFACDKCGRNACRGPVCYGYGVGGTVDVEFAGCPCACAAPCGGACGCDAGPGPGCAAPVGPACGAPAFAGPACGAPACGAPACGAPAYVAPTCDYGYAAGGCDNGCGCGSGRKSLFSKMMDFEHRKNSWLKKRFCGLRDDCDCVPVYYYGGCDAGCAAGCGDIHDAAYGLGPGPAGYGAGGYGAAGYAPVGHGAAGCGCN